MDTALADASLVIEGEYRVGHQEQLYIENQAMIAEPRPDGGITITGSMQCPYYVHDALKRALALSDTQAVITQAETGGGFGGKEEYPSVVAIHAALLAQRVGRPVRMIYDRHEDIAATTKRHPAIVRHRTGVSADGELVAQDVEVIMDGGAYCTLTPVVLSRGILHAGGPYHCPNAAHPRSSHGHEHAAQRRLPRLRGAAGRVRGRAPGGARRPMRWASRPRSCGSAGCTARATSRRPARCLRESVGAAEVLERASEAAEYERIRELSQQTRAVRWGQAADAGRGIHSVRVRSVSGIGLAMAWHGAGFTGRGEVHLASVAGVELGDDGVVRVLIANTEIGQGTKTIFPMLAAEALGIEPDEVEMARGGHLDRARQRPDRGLAHGHGRGRARHQGRRAPAEHGRGAQRRPLRRDVSRADARTHGATRIDQRFEPYPDVDFDDVDLHRRRLPGLRLGLRGGPGGRGPRHGRGPRAQRRLGGRRRPRHPPRPGRGPGRGRHAAGRRLRHHRGDEGGRTVAT